MILIYQNMDGMMEQVIEIIVMSIELKKTEVIF